MMIVFLTVSLICWVKQLICVQMAVASLLRCEMNILWFFWKLIALGISMNFSAAGCLLFENVE